MTPIGIVVLLIGVAYMMVARYWLSDAQTAAAKEGWKRRTFRDLIRDYKLTGRARRLAIRPGSPFIGHRLDDLRLRQRYGANIVGIERWRKFRRVMVSVAGNTELRLNDVLLIDMSASEVDLREFCTSQRLEPMVLRGEYFSEQARDVGMAEVSLILIPNCWGKPFTMSVFAVAMVLAWWGSGATVKQWKGFWLTNSCSWAIFCWLSATGA